MGFHALKDQGSLHIIYYKINQSESSSALKRTLGTNADTEKNNLGINFDFNINSIDNYKTLHICSASLHP